MQSNNIKPNKGVYPKDVILTVLGKIKADGAVYKCIDFTGSYVDALGVSGRMTICNMAVEMGAKTAYIQPNQEVLEYVAARAVRPYEVMHTDPDFVYAESHVFDVSAMEPVVSCPHDVDNVHPITEVAAQKIPLNQAYIGSCTNGRYEDLEAAAAVLKGKKISPYVRGIVSPATSEIYAQAMRSGILQIFADAGFCVTNPTCGACLGMSNGVLAENEVCASTTNRNFNGRMGKGGMVHLMSPASAAAAAVTGTITNSPLYKEC
jgi:3-isopropylmalate/(R)-2-methylmalate dehydratase large subunit